MANRTEFLESIRHRTQGGRYKPTQAPDVAWTPKEEPRESVYIEDPPARGARNPRGALQARR
jgi:hypothetical protein